MSNTVSNVTLGKPKVGGAIYRAPITTASNKIPTSASATLDVAFVCLGYVSDDGLTNANSPESSKIKAWGGDVVLTLQTEKQDTFSFKLIEALDLNVLQAVYGTANATGALSTGITVNAKSTEPEEAIWVIDMVLRGGALKRIVIPDGKITEISEIVYKDDEAVGYGITLQAMPDSNGATHIEYILKSS